MDQYQYNPIIRRLDLVSNATTTLFIAGATVGGQRVVTVNSQGQVLHADHTMAGHAGRIAGLTLTSALAGEAVTVRRAGLMTDPGWHWDPDQPRLFLSGNGTLTQTVPGSGFVCVVGFCLSATQLFIDIQPAITLQTT
ncbi:MAG: hypothetical protein H7838_09270 [Magnetococcus sp. DMHC-8]